MQKENAPPKDNASCPFFITAPQQFKQQEKLNYDRNKVENLSNSMNYKSASMV